MDVNFFGVLHGVMAAYPFMAARSSGHIVNTASLSGLVALPAVGPYTASKFAVVGLSKSLRAEAAPLGVKVSVVCPATVATHAFDAGEYRNIDKQAFARALPSKAMSAEQCATLIMRGVRRNQELITPGQASVIASLERYAPAVTRLMAKKFGKQLKDLRRSDTHSA
jgi:short-subunit dehydrogenase